MDEPDTGSGAPSDRVDGLQRALLVSPSTDLVARLTQVLHEQFSADVLAEQTSGRADDRLEGVDLVVLDVADPASAAAELRRRSPAVAILVVGREASAPVGADAVLDRATLAGDAVAVPTVVAAITTALVRRAAAYAVERWRGVAVQLLDEMRAAAALVDPAGEIVAANAAWRELATDSAEGSYFLVCRPATGTDGPYAAQAQEGVRRVLRGELERFTLDHPCRSAGDERWYRLQVTALPQVGGALLQHVDVSSDGAAGAGISLRDPLTGLANRQLLHDRLTQALAGGAQADHLVVVAGFDIDQFTRVNETWGQAAGDELLRGVAVRLEQLTSAGDTIARAAVDEFDIVHPGVPSTEGALEWARELATAFDEPFPLTSATVAVTASGGVYVAGPQDTADDVLRNLDAAVRAAKREGHGRLRLWSDDLVGDDEGRLRTEQELREGIDAGQFQLHYQPVVDLRQRRVVGVEALLRWYHPEAIRLPDTFIPIAEDSGLIVPLGGWVVEEACRQAALWAGEGLALDIAVNLSARQVAHPDTIATIERALATSRLDPYRLLIEVTETAVVEDAEAAKVALDTGGGARGTGGDRRLRYGLQLAALPQALPDPGAEDRPGLRLRHGHQ